MEDITVRVKVNGEDITRTVAPNRRLIDFLRDDLNLKSVKEGCSVGECGACTIIFNGNAVTSCMMLVGQADGSEIITLEGLSKNGELDLLQETFMEAGAVQCGYCTPGMILSAKALFMHNPNPSKEEIQMAISGNLCRCTGYTKIIQAIEMARDKMEHVNE